MTPGNNTASGKAPEPQYGEPWGLYGMASQNVRTDVRASEFRVIDVKNPALAARIVASVNALAGRDPEALGELVAAFRQVIESWGPPYDDTRWSCDEDSTDCEVADPRTDNEGVRCEFHAMMKRARKALARFQGGGP